MPVASKPATTGCPMPRSSPTKRSCSARVLRTVSLRRRAVGPDHRVAFGSTGHSCFPPPRRAPPRCELVFEALSCIARARWPLPNPLLLRLTIGLLVVGFLSLLGIVGMTDWLGRRAQALFADAIAARDTRAAAVELRNALLAAESSERGYLLTGNEIYLAPYKGARASALSKISSLEGGKQDRT